MTKNLISFQYEGKFGPNFEFMRSIVITYLICRRLDGLFHHYLNGIMVKRHKRDEQAAFHTMPQKTVLTLYIIWEGPFKIIIIILLSIQILLCKYI